MGSVTWHPRYRAEGNQQFDMAVLKVAADSAPTAATLRAAGVVSVRLNGWSWPTPTDKGPSTLRVAGYGSTRANNGAGGSFTLRLGVAPVAFWASCTPFTAAVPVAVDAATQVCTLPVSGSNPSASALCERDSGGPLYEVWEWEGVQVAQLFGVASYWLARPGGAACPLGLPNVFTRVAPLREWIWRVM